MNKVFKVIWSEARNAYVVVSEIAKNHGSKSCSTKKLLAMLIATGVMTCASMAPAMAANPAPNDTKIEVGKGASAVEKSVAIGNDASVVAGSNGSGGVALGNKAHAGYKGTSLGSSAISGREGATLVGANTNSASLYTTVIGTDSVINSDGTSYKVKIDTFFGTYEKDVNIQGATATLVGTSNKVDNKNKLVYSGVANNVMGAANTIEASNGVTIQGSGNTVTDAYKDMNISTSEGLKVLLGDYSVLAGKESGAIAVVGGANTVSKQTDSTVIGYDNKLTSDKEKGSQNVFMAGSHNTLTNVSDSLVMGNDNTISDRSNVISFGYKNAITANNAVAIGNGASVSAEGGVALGVGSVADRANAVSVGSTGANRQIINVAAGTADTDAVNVSQLKDVKAEALKHSTVTDDGVNITVTDEGFNADGGKEYKVALKNDIYLAGDDPDAFVSISGSKGTIWTSGRVTAGSVAVGTAKADGTTPFFVDSNGAFYAADSKFSVDKDGNANANSIQTNALNSKYNLSVGTANVNGTMPFFVNSNGAFYAANGKLVVDKDGKVTATEGEIGNVVLKNGVLYKNTALRDGELYVGDADGNYSQITPKSAKLGQVTIDEKGNIAGVNSVQTNALNAKYNLSVGTANENGTVPFFVNSNGAFYAANGKLVVDKDGKVTATEGEIGNVVLKNGVLYKNTALRDGELYVGDADGNYSQITPKSAKLGQVTIDEKGNIAGVNSVQTNALNAKYNLSVGTANENGTVPFFVNSNGAFYAANGKLVVDKDGKVTATEGEIGNVVLKNGVLYKNTALRDGELYVGDASGNYSQITTKGAKLGKVTIAADGKIHGVTAGTADTDAVNVSQLKAVGATANMGWNLSTNGVATEATNVKPGDFVDFSGDKNISVKHDGAKVQVELNKDIDVNSVQTNALNAKYNLSVGTANANGIMPFFVNSNGAFYAANNNFSVDKDGKVTATAGEIGNVVLNNGVFTGHSALRDGELFVGDASGNYSQITTKGAKLGKVTIDEQGNIAGANHIQTNALNAKYNLSVGTANANGIMPFFVNSNGAFYAANNNFSVDKDGKVIATAGEIGNVVLNNGVFTGHSALRDGELFVGDASGNYSQITTKGAKLGKVTIDEQGNIAGANHIQTNALNAKYNLSVGTANANGIMPFFVNSNGAFYAANNNFSVDKDGKVTATAGEIGNVVLNNGVFYKNSALRDGELFIGDADGNYSQITPKSAKLGKVTIDKDGKISGVAAGAVTADSTDAVNGSQLHAVATEASKHSKVVNGSNINVEETDLDGQKVYKVNLNKDIMLGDLTGKYVSISGTNGTIEATGAIATKDRVYADKGAKLADIDVTGDTISNGDAKLALNGAAGTAGMINGKGASVYMQDGYTVINSKVAFDQNGKISGVAAGAVTADSTDAVNGSQLHAVATEAGKHSKVVSGNNINVEETDVDGQKFYKVNMNKDIILGDLTGKYVNISGTNGTIEATGAIATKDRVYADKGAKLADIDVTGNKISNGASSIVLDGSNVKVNDKVTIDQNGKISGVAAGEVSDTSTDAINGSQLKETNDRVAANETAIKNNTEAISKLDGRVTANETAIKNNTEAISKLDGRVTANETAIKNNAEAIGSLNTRVDGVEKLAKQHTTVTAGDNVTVTEDTNKDGGKEYKVALKKDINLDSVTTGQTVMNNDGLKVGDKVSVTATAVTAGKTSISDEGVKVGDKTYISDKGLNANDQKVTNVAAGEISATSKDAVNGSQLYKTNQEVVNNTNRINQLGSRVNKVGAGAAALAALHPMDFDPDDKLTFSAGYGNYGGENAAAIGAYYRPDEKVMFSVGGTVGNGENMVNAGVSFSLDRTNHVSNSRTAMAREILDLRAEVTELKAMVAKGGLGSIAEDKMKIFPDVAENHWAYEYVGKLAAAGIIEGYPDGKFSGDRMMSRYEFAAMLYRAMQKGAQLDSKIINEFAPEMGRIRVDRISGEDGDRDKIERVRVNAVKGERDHYGNKIAKAEAKAK